MSALCYYFAETEESHEDETPLLVWIGRSWRRWGSHLLMSERQPLPQYLHIIRGIIEGWRGAGVVLEVWGKSGFSPGSDHRR